MIFRDSGFGFNLSGLNYIYILLIGVSDLGGGGLKAQQAPSPGQAKRHPGLRIAIVLTPCKGKSIRCRKYI